MYSILSKFYFYLVSGRMDNFTRNVGESQSFLVNVSPGATAGAWFRNGVPLTSGAKYSITQNTGTLRRMTVQNIQTSDSGEYVYVVNGVESKGYLTVTRMYFYTLYITNVMTY